MPPPTTFAEEALAALDARFPGRIAALRPAGGEPGALVSREHVRPVLSWLAKEPSLALGFLVDLTAVDRLGLDPGCRDWRFSVVYRIAALPGGRRFQVVAKVPREEPVVPTVGDLWESAAWAEREVADLFGIRFEGNPDPARLLLPAEYPGYPLRKDYPTQGRGERDRPGAEEGAAGSHRSPSSGPIGPLEGVGTVEIPPVDPLRIGAPRIRARLAGRRVVAAEAEIGYAHSGLEKLAETLTYRQAVVAVARLCAESSVQRSIGYAIAIESLLGIEPPARARVLRVILCEVARILDHLAAFAEGLHVAGAPLARSRVLAWVDSAAGRLGGALGPGGGGLGVADPCEVDDRIRIGGFREDFPPAFLSAVRWLAAEAPSWLDDACGEAARSRRFRDRLRGAGTIRAADALRLGLTGPALRACGVPYDVRRARPYGGYDRFDFDVPTRDDGDARARHLQRLAEARESAGILKQALASLPEGSVLVDSAKVAQPSPGRRREGLEGLIHHVKLAVEGFARPPERGAEVFSSTEASGGELGFHVVSGGDSRPYRLHLRTPSFYHCGALPGILGGCTLPQARAAVASLSLVEGEIDR